MKKIVLGIWLLSATLAFAQTPPAENKAEAEELPHIEFKETTHDFGQIPLQADATHEFTFSNTGKVPLVLSNVRASCGCTVPEWPKEPVLPGEEGVIKIKYTTVNRPNVINKAVIVHSNADNKQVILRIKGEVVKEG